ncbi:unnamed protein product [Cunninghamella echinulata]
MAQRPSSISSPNETSLISTPSSPSLTITNGHGWRDHVPWGNVSLDHFTNYARRASNSSLNLLNVFPLSKSEVNEQRLVEKVQKGNQCYKTLQLSLKDNSKTLSKISEHIHRRVPQMIHQSQELNNMGKKVEDANSDLIDARDIVRNMESIDSFINMIDMIQHSIHLIKENKK